MPFHFATFYRAELRWVAGARLGSKALAKHYASWAAGQGAPSINYREMGRYMAALGHQRVHSDGRRFCDVGLAAEYGGEPDDLSGRVAAAANDGIDRKVDFLVEQMRAVRGELRALRQQPSREARS